jgi:hypothetical protein
MTANPALATHMRAQDAEKARGVVAAAAVAAGKPPAVVSSSSMNTLLALVERLPDADRQKARTEVAALA